MGNTGKWNREEKSRLRQMVESLPAGALFLDGDHLYLNEAAETLTGYRNADVPTLDAWFTMLYGTQAEVVRNLYEQDKEAGFPVPRTVLLRHKAGTHRFVEFAAYAYESGEVWLLYDVTARKHIEEELERDVTARKQAEADLRKSQEGLKQAQALAHVGSWEYDVAMQWNVWSDEMFHIFGLDPASLPPAIEEVIQYVHPEDVDRFFECAVEALNGGKSYELEHRLIRADGGLRHVRSVCQVVCTPEGELTRLHGIVMDITEIKQATEAIRINEARFRAMNDASPLGVFVTEENGECLYTNSTWQRITGMQEAETLGKGWIEAVYPLERERVSQAWHEAIREHKPFYATFRFLRPDKLLVWVSMNAAAMWEGERLLGYVATVEDISERVQTEQLIRANEARFRAAVEGSLDAFYLLESARDSHGRIEDFIFIDLNTRGAELISRSREEIIGQRLCELLPINRTAGFFEKYVRVVETGESLEEEFAIEAEEIDAAWLHHQVIRVGDGVAITTRDITERKQFERQLVEQQAELLQVNGQLESQKEELQQANAKLAAQATTDGLTGLKNHRAFQDKLKEEFARGARYGKPLSVILLDVDRFKQYNDMYGHPAGDVVLKTVAELLETTARETDFVARYGGEEFVVVLPGTGAEKARIAAERFRVAIEQAAWPERPVTASFGITTLTPMFASTAELLSSADQALYRSKQRGRNCVTHCTELEEETPLEELSTSSYANLMQEMLNVRDSTLETAPEPIRATLLQAYDATIESWSRILDMKDSETEGHTQRVTKMTEQLARSVGLSEEERLYARWGALLHDIGKIGIPDSILLKPGPLTDEERAVMQRHPGIAYEMLSPIAFLRPALDIPHCHHEKWDGTGYPRGLKGEAIPLAARLFAVVDVWDALRSDRPYRRGGQKSECGTICGSRRERTSIRRRSRRFFDCA